MLRQDCHFRTRKFTRPNVNVFGAIRLLKRRLQRNAVNAKTITKTNIAVVEYRLFVICSDVCMLSATVHIKFEIVFRITRSQLYHYSKCQAL